MFRLSPSAEALASHAPSFPWFINTGQPFDIGANADFVPVPGARAAISGLLSPQWEAYRTKALNAITLPVAMKNQKLYDDAAEPLSEQIRDLLGADFDQRIGEQLQCPPARKTEAIGNIRGMVVWACLEEHWAPYIDLPWRAYKEMYEWLQRGRLPCGAVGAYPSRVFRIF